TTLSPGDTFTVTANFTCAAQLGVHPRYTDYYTEVPVNNNGYEHPILLAHCTLMQARQLLSSTNSQLR
ncbi:hypothetical protein EV702DRAFT_56714, partial [Suillus placidus]